MTPLIRAAVSLSLAARSCFVENRPRTSSAVSPALVTFCVTSPSTTNTRSTSLCTTVNPNSSSQSRTAATSTSHSWRRDFRVDASVSASVAVSTEAEVAGAVSGSLFSLSPEKNESAESEDDDFVGAGSRDRNASTPLLFSRSFLRNSSSASAASSSNSSITTGSFVAWIKTPSTSARSDVLTKLHDATYTTAHCVPLASARSHPTVNVFSPVHTTNRVKTASPKVSNPALASSYVALFAKTPPNSCMPRIAKTVRNRKKTKQNETIRRTPFTTAAKTCRNARCFRSPFRPAKMRSTRSVRNVAMPSAPDPNAISATPLTTTTPSNTFHGFAQYFCRPSATCFKTNSKMKTDVNTNSHVLRAE
mmetsp:Transcript_7362/g.27729  ORF Transcript_7362/g.27729 Transcript_7362/m.27729 type:complete len:363 (-) Transcript_7362:1484-2572(-)